LGLGLGPDLQMLTWSVSLRGRSDGDIERDVATLVDAIGHALAQHFPEASGYETVWSRLSGPIEGATARVARGRFRAAVSVQRFARAHADDGGVGSPRALEVRLVATAEVAPPVGSTRADAARRSGSGDGVRAATCAAARAGSLAAFCAIGTAAFGALALGTAGLLGAWAEALLLLPTLVVWRATLALSRARAAPVAELPAAPERARPRPHDPTVRDAMGRWQRVLKQLRGHRQLLDDRSSLAPFRAPPRSLNATG
jgi:hypothetical protein